MVDETEGAILESLVEDVGKFWTANPGRTKGIKPLNGLSNGWKLGGGKGGESSPEAMSGNKQGLVVSPEALELRENFLPNGF
jgi:hypothetical protein